MRKTNKKGFTIVELVIVIAVIAILAAVLIPTYSSLVKKANRSADIQAVREMNTALAMNEVTKGKTVNEVYDALAEAGMSTKDYIPLTDGNHFYWIGGELNRVVYTDENDTVIYPEEHKNKTLDDLKKVYSTYSVLSGIIGMTEVDVDANGVADNVKTAEQLYYLCQKMPAGLKEIKLASGTIDLKGANISFVLDGSGKNLTITGATDADGNPATTFTGMVINDNKLDGDGTNDKEYAAGFIGLVDNGAEVTISNITIEGATVGTTNIGGVGAIVGRVDRASKVTISNCKVINTTVTGRNKVGALVGSVGGNVKLEISGCEVSKVTVNCSEGESGMVVGCVYNGGAAVTIDKEFEDWVNETTLNLVSDKYTNRKTVDTAGKTITATKTDVSYTVDGCQKMLSIYDEETRYRMFANDAYMTIFQNNDGGSNTKSSTYKIGDDVKHTAINTMVSHTEQQGGKNVTVYDNNAKLENTDYIVNILYFVK